MFRILRLKNLSFVFDELGVLVPLWLDWTFFSEVWFLPLGEGRKVKL